MGILEAVLDKISPKRGLTKDEFRAFRKSFVPTTKCNLPVVARINETDDYIELCLRPKDLPRWRFNLAENGLANNDLLAEILTEMERNPDLTVRFRHWYASTASSSTSEGAFVQHQPQMIVS